MRMLLTRNPYKLISIYIVMLQLIYLQYVAFMQRFEM